MADSAHACMVCVSLKASGLGLCSAEQVFDALGAIPEAVELHTDVGAGQYPSVLQLPVVCMPTSCPCLSVLMCLKILRLTRCCCADHRRPQVPAPATGCECARSVHPLHGSLHLLPSGQHQQGHDRPLQPRHHVCNGEIALFPF